jgi:hypothetical protein
VLAVAFRFLGAHSLTTGLAAGVIVILVNHLLLSFNVFSLTPGAGRNLLRYFAALVFLRLPAMAGLLYVFAVLLRFNLLGIALGMATGSVIGIGRLVRTRKEILEATEQPAK